MSSKSKPYGKLEKEQVAFDAMLDDLMVEHAGQFVVVKGGEVQGFYPTFEDAYAAALEQFGLEEEFLVSEVRQRGSETASISWATGAMFG